MSKENGLEGRYFVRAHMNLRTPLYQIIDRETDQPVNPLWFYARKEDAEERIRRAR